MTLPLLQTNNLGQVYPDVSSELCNKHVKQLSKLKSLFGEIYDEMQPQGFILVNGVAKVVDLGADLQLDFALENGVTILYSKTYKNQAIFINGNHVQEEIQFNSKGKHQDGIHQKIDEIKSAIKKIRLHASPSKQFYGGIIYIHSNIPENQLGYSQCFMIGVILGFLMIHEQLASYNTKKLIELIINCDDKLSQKTVVNLLQNYEVNKIMADVYIESKHQTQRSFDINVLHPKSDRSIGTIESSEAIKFNQRRHQTYREPNSRESIECAEVPTQIFRQELTHCNIKLKENHKLIFCKIDLSQSEENYYKSKVKIIEQLNHLLKEKNIHKSDIFNEKGHIQLSPILKGLINQEELSLLEYCEEVRNLIVALVRGRLQFDDFIVQKHRLDVEYQMHDEGVIDLLQQVRTEIKCLQHFCIVQGKTLLISMDKSYYTEVMVYLRKLLNDYKFSTHKFLETFKKIQSEQKPTDINEVMFTTMPSRGCAIYLPDQEEEIWL